MYQINVLINQLIVQVIASWCLFSKTDSADTVISNLHKIKQRTFLRNTVYDDQYVSFVYMPPPIANPLNLPISRTFLRTMYVQTQRETEGLGQIQTRVMLCGQHVRPDYDKQK